MRGKKILTTSLVLAVFLSTCMSVFASNDRQKLLVTEEASIKRTGIDNTSQTSGMCGDNLTWSFAGETGTLTISGSGEMWDACDYDFGVFWSNDSVTNVIFVGNITSIGAEAFSGSCIENISIPSSVTNIGAAAFVWCDCLKKITIPNSVISIGDHAFSFCSSLTSMSIPQSVKFIGASAFSGCSSLTSITIPDGVTEIGEYMFSDCSSMKNVTIPNSVTSIGDGAFFYCESLESIIIPSSVTSIGERAFFYCESLESITIPSSVTSIGESAFYWCNSITKITLPRSVRDIGKAAFSACTNLRSLNVEDDNPYFSSEDGVLYNKNKTTLVCYPSGKSGEFIISNSVICIEECAFLHCDRLTNITIPNTVTEIGMEAFFYCTKLTKIVIPNSITGIEYWTFASCENLVSIELPNSIEYIGQGAFEGTGISSLVLPNSLTSIGFEAFRRCKNITNIIIPNSVTYIGDNAFYGCTSLTKVIIPSTTTSIGDDAFEECNNFRDIYYSGTEEKWNKIKNAYGEKLNLSLNPNVTIHFNYVSNPLSIISYPANVTAKVNDSVSFSVKAQGEGLTYQWYYKKAGQTAWNKWGARTTATTTATANATWNGMQVYCKVTDKDGNSVDSNPATITIKQDLKITAQPTDKTVKLGESLTLSVRAEGIGLTYQWYYKKADATSFTKWNGRTHASETVTPNVSWNGIQLYCTVKDSSGNSLDSSVAKITVTQDLKITAQPTNKTIKKGDSVTLSLKAEGTGLTYQWYYKKAGATSFSTWNGRTHASETVTPNTTWNGIQLYCVVKDSSGKKVQSNTIKVLFSDVVTIVTQPTNVTAKTGDNVTFKFVAEGVGLTYQWYYKKAGATAWSKWNGRTTASTTATANASWDGMQVYCVVKNSSGSTLNSNIAKITLSDVLAITQQPSNVTTQAGQNVTFTVKAKGVGLKYQWQYKKSGQASWSNWGARTTASTTATSNATWNGMQVRCIVTDSAGNKITSNAATITIK